MLRKIVFLSFFLILSIISVHGFTKSNVPKDNANQEHTKMNEEHKPFTIGILIPIEHKALQEIVSGFKESVIQQYPNTIFDIQNAQGDIKLERSILERFAGKKEDLIVPIGTTATQMTLSYIKQQPIVSLAADYSEEDRQKRSPKNITGVLDEIGGIKKLDLIKKLYPKLKKITLVYHNGNEKNFKEIKQIENHGKELSIQVQKLGINGLPELETVSSAIDKDSEAVLILKDHLIASGIKLLLSPVEKRGIPLIASDEGSVHEGAAFALGVKEKTIGLEGGKFAVQVLRGADISKMPMHQIESLAVFYNPAAGQKQKVKGEKLKAIAKEDHYSFVAVF